jgi:hypothetical protein
MHFLSLIFFASFAATLRERKLLWEKEASVVNAIDEEEVRLLPEYKTLKQVQHGYDDEFFVSFAKRHQTKNYLSMNQILLNSIFVVVPVIIFSLVLYKVIIQLVKDRRNKNQAYEKIKSTAEANGP